MLDISLEQPAPSMTQYERTWRMGTTPFHRGVRLAGRRLVALALVLALVVAPLVVTLTHGPAAQAAAASVAADMIGETAAHGPGPGHTHAHAHTHTHGHDDAERDHQGGLLGGHNPLDHDHQLHALICPPSSAPTPFPDETPCASGDAFRALTPEGPRRPPRSV